MGVWFLSLALGNNLAGLLAAGNEATSLASLPAYFLKMFGWGACSGLALLVLAPLLKRWMAGVR
jgi:POT family proton-dependent oligopeptide transporter